MKLCNFLPFDSTYSGVELKNTGKYNRIIWNRYEDNRPMLEKDANDTILGNL